MLLIYIKHETFIECQQVHMKNIIQFVFKFKIPVKGTVFVFLTLVDTVAGLSINWW